MKKTIEMKTGIVVVDSDEIQIAEETLTPLVDFAGIVADKKGEVPYILFFSETPVEKYNCREEDEVLDKLVSIRPEYQKVRETEISLEAVGKKDATLETWARAMRLGIFAIPNVEDENHLDHGVGIIRFQEI